MKYKEMTVWSAGENAKTKKLEFVMGIIIFIMWLVGCFAFFTQNMNDDKTIEMKLWEHILCGFFMSILTSILDYLDMQRLHLQRTQSKEMQNLHYTFTNSMIL